MTKRAIRDAGQQEEKSIKGRLRQWPWEKGPGSRGWAWGGMPKVPASMGMWLVQAWLLPCVP